MTLMHFLTLRSPGRVDFSGRYAEFISLLRASLAAQDIEFVNAEIASGAGTREWRVTVNVHDRGVLALRAPLDPGVDPLSAEVCHDVARRVLAHIRSTSPEAP